jgi:hypothetical protein
MNSTFLGIPKFCRTQRVCFVGGEGIVLSHTSEAGSWTYTVEMALGLEPLCGRVGAETMVVLNEADLQAWNGL